MKNDTEQTCFADSCRTDGRLTALKRYRLRGGGLPVRPRFEIETAEDRLTRYTPLLNDTSVLKQVEAVLVISALGPAALPSVSQALRQVDPTGGIAAVLRMGTDALPLLEEVTALLKRRNPAFVRNACHILASWGPDAVPALPALKATADTSSTSGKLHIAALHAVEVISKGP